MFHKNVKNTRAYEKVDHVLSLFHLSMTGTVCLIMVLVIFTAGYHYAKEGLTKNGRVSTCDNEKRYTYLRMNPDENMSFTYTPLGDNPESLRLNFSNFDGRATIKISIKDSSGKTLKSRTRSPLMRPDKYGGHYTTAKIMLDKLHLKKGKPVLVSVKLVGDKSDAKLYLKCYKIRVTERLPKYRALSPEVSGKSVEPGYSPCVDYMYGDYFCEWYVYDYALLCLLILALAFIRGRLKLPAAVLDIMYAVTVPALTCLGVEWIYGGVHNWDPYLFFGNYLMILAFYSLILFITGSGRAAAPITMVVYYAFALANLYITEFRERPLMPWDLLAARTAGHMAASYKYQGSAAAVICLLGMLAFAEVNARLTAGKRRPVVRRAIALVLCLAAFIPDMKYMVSRVEPNQWNMAEIYRTYGSPMSFARYWQFSRYEKPEDYDREKLEKVLKDEKTIPARSTTRAQNVIVVMNETFSDVRTIGGDRVTRDYMPFYDSMKKNAVKGHVSVPVFGGGTANTEFEVLTGLSTAFIPGTPYQMYVRNEIPSLAREYAGDGYKTYAFHPSLGTNYNRSSAYPLLGFDRFFTLDDLDMSRVRMIRQFVSDESDYDFVESVDRKTKGDMFMMNVTIQNHSAYRDAKGPETDIDGDVDAPEARQYLALIQESDKALKNLISYYKKSDEPTLICFFGDHMARIEDSYYSYLYGKPVTEVTPEENMKQRMTPFVIWTNYDIDEESGLDRISSFYLHDLIRLYSGWDLTGFDAYLYNLYQKYPVITPAGVFDSDGRFYNSASDVRDPVMEEYSDMVYMRLRDMHLGR